MKLNNWITDKHRIWQWKDNSSLLGRFKVIASTFHISDDIAKLEKIAIPIFLFFINNISIIVSVIRKIAPPSCVITLATGVATSPIKNFETNS